MRWSSCARARGASPTRARRRSSCTTASSPPARTAGRRCAFDLLAVNSLIAPLLSAGFYYKTFMWPASFWEKVYEPLIRRAAGLGRASGEERPRHLREGVPALRRAGGRRRAGGPDGGAGGGPDRRARHPVRRGLSPRRAAARRAPGRGRPQLGRVGGAHRRPSWRRCPMCASCARTTVFGVYDGGTYSALERVNDHLAEPPAHEPRQRLWRIVAKRCVLAAGAIERPLVFGDNDRPGVMLAGAVRTYLNRYAVAPGRRAVVFGTNDETARTVADLARAGVHVAAVVDPRRERARQHRGRGQVGRRAPHRRRRRHARHADRCACARSMSGPQPARRCASPAISFASPAAGVRRASDLASRRPPRLERGHRGLRARRRCRRA